MHNYGPSIQRISALRQMGRKSCSIQRTMPSVDATAEFRANYKSEVPSKPQLKEKAMKKTAMQKPKDENRSINAPHLGIKIRRAIVNLSFAAAASLAVHGEVGNQPALVH
jgi:hypothetical protein